MSQHAMVRHHGGHHPMAYQGGGTPGQHRHRAFPGLYAHEIPNLPGFEEMKRRYSVTNTDRWEVIRTGLYDSLVYPAIGTPQLTFFQNPQGQGIGFGGGPKNLSDTNMVASGTVPANNSFLIKTIEVDFWPTTPSVAAQLPAAFGPQAAAQIINDQFAFYRSGSLTLLIGSKDYLEEAPLAKFPSQTQFSVSAAVCDATTPGAAFQTRIAYANIHGRPYHISPADLRVEATQNFSIRLKWEEGNQPLPSANPARVFVRVDGLLYRLSQ